MRLNRNGRQMATMREGTTTSSARTPDRPLQNHVSLGRFIQLRKRLNAARASSKTSTVSASFNLLFIYLPLSIYGYTDDGAVGKNHKYKWRRINHQQTKISFVLKMRSVNILSNTDR